MRQESLEEERICSEKPLVMAEVEAERYLQTRRPSWGTFLFLTAETGRAELLEGENFYLSSSHEKY